MKDLNSSLKNKNKILLFDIDDTIVNTTKHKEDIIMFVLSNLINHGLEIIKENFLKITKM